MTTLIVSLLDETSSISETPPPSDLMTTDYRALVSRSQTDPWLRGYLRSSLGNEDFFSRYVNFYPDLQSRNYYDFFSNYMQEKEDDGLDKTYGFLVPMIIIIGLVSLTIPAVAIMFFMFMYKSNSGSSGCSLTGQSQTKQTLPGAEPKLLDSVVDLMGTIEKALSFVEQNRNFGNKSRHHRGHKS